MYDSLEIPIPDVPPGEVVPPHNIEAEQAVLGSVLLEQEVFDQVSEVLRGDEFFLKKHELIYKAMAEAYDDGDPIDIVTVHARMDDPAMSGGLTYLTELASATPTAANVMHYVKIVKDHAVHRRALQQVQGLVAAAGNAESGAELIAKMQMVAATLEDEVAPKKDFTPIGIAVREAYERIEQMASNPNARGITGLESGFPDLDHMTAGFQKGDMIIVAARPSVGKTAFALNIAQNIGLAGETVAVFSLEMPTSQLVQRMLCAEANIDASRMRTGYLQDDDWTKLTMAIGRLSERKIFIDDSAVITANEIRAKCRRLKKEHGLGLVVIDYLQLIQGQRRRNDNRQTEVAEISRTLKQIAKELDVPVIALSQLSRGVEQRQDKRPMMSDLRESGSIEQDADIVAFLYRDDYYDKETEKKNIIEIIIAKQRNGPVGTVELVFLKNFNKFVSLDHGHELPERREPDPRRQWA
ncbi:replicative DNA helicase [Paenibacillus sp. 32O-W]|uniref:replicative DNA helicase n=1 Tax=Paenibacillus sp. 32O-W TaxID=1695218 RepID=UPI0007214CE9|nr:replicative DNA helicase [Paenibacillus sp. 32O-W]ALS27168.1 replicative DNA helicase [Paenibacillus sp. 32O-W]